MSSDKYSKFAASMKSKSSSGPINIHSHVKKEMAPKPPSSSGGITRGFGLGYGDSISY